MRHLLHQHCFAKVNVYADKSARPPGAFQCGPVAGNGKQRGYFANEHADGDRDCGTFEGKVTTSGGEVTLEGTFNFTRGRLEGIHGGGTYKGRLLSPTEIQMTWTGAYEVTTVAGRVA